MEMRDVADEWRCFTGMPAWRPDYRRVSPSSLVCVDAMVGHGVVAYRRDARARSPARHCLHKLNCATTPPLPPLRPMLHGRLLTLTKMKVTKHRNRAHQ